jgi:hypothetical protein
MFTVSLWDLMSLGLGLMDMLMDFWTVIEMKTVRLSDEVHKDLTKLKVIWRMTSIDDVIRELLRRSGF